MNSYVASFISNGCNALYSIFNPVSITDLDTPNQFKCHISKLPRDVWNELLKHGRSHLVAIACVSKSFNELANAYAKNYNSTSYFGENKWRKHGAHSLVSPSVPLKMIQYFDETKWLLTYIPEVINGEQLTLSSVDRFVSLFKKGTDPLKSNYVSPLVKFGLDDETVKPFKAHFVMLSKDVLDESKSKDFAVQKKIVEEKGYEIPSLMDVVVSILLHNLETGDFLYPDGQHGHQWTYTRVQEQYNSKLRIIVGGFSALGLSVDTFNNYGGTDIAVSCAKTFPLLTSK